MKNNYEKYYINYIIPVEQDKREYYQYLGFIKSFNLFNNNTYFELFNFSHHSITYNEFKNFKINNKLPLGKRIELFFEFYINSLNKYKILYKNIQIIHDKLTLGEIDFILEDNNTKEIIHLEFVYKFYLYITNNNEIKRYIGPNNHDSLMDKFNKLKNKQFPILYNKHTKKYLQDIDINNINQKLCLKGNIFIPYNKIDLEFNHINDKCVCGYYLSYKEFKSIKKFKLFKYFIPQKEDWIIEVKYCTIWYEYEDIISQIDIQKLSNINPLIWIKNNNTYEKIFIT